MRIQIPSPKPTKNLETKRPQNIFIFVFNVRPRFSAIHIYRRYLGIAEKVCISVADYFFFTTERNGRKTLTTVQGLPKKFDQKKILKVIKKKFGKSMQFQTQDMED